MIESGKVNVISQRLKKSILTHGFFVLLFFGVFLSGGHSPVSAASDNLIYNYSANPMYHYEFMNGETNRDKIVKDRNDYIRKLLNDKWASDFYGFYDTNYQRYPALDISADRKKEMDKNYSEMDAVVRQITAGISDNMEKYKAIHMWVARNIYYGYKENAPLPLAAAEAFAGRFTTCWGYAAIESYMLKVCGIPNVIVYGLTSENNGGWSNIEFENAGSHSWIMAYINGAWHNSDPTFDSGNTYENGEYIKKDRTMRWFDFLMKSPIKPMQ